jgi:hypothetical protein
VLSPPTPEALKKNTRNTPRPLSSRWSPEPARAAGREASVSNQVLLRRRAATGGLGGMPLSATLPEHAQDRIPAMQRALGNQAMQRLARSCPVFPNRCPFGGACHSCPPRVQAKLTISRPGDKYEQEADRVAEQVMGAPEPRLQRHAAPEEEEEREIVRNKPLGGRITPLVQRHVALEEQVVQRMPDSDEEQPHPEALRAASHAMSMLDQTKPRIWFDSWYNDGRDNNSNGQYDQDDREERATEDHDGTHYRGGGVWPGGARIRRGMWPITWEEQVPPNSIMYKVCVDVVSESYRSAGSSLGTRSVAGLESHCESSSRFRTWRKDRREEYPDLLPGDIVTYKTNKHSHSGIVGTNKQIIHLPGPSNWMYFNSASKNDMESTWQWVWRTFFGTTQVSRLVSRRRRTSGDQQIRRRSFSRIELGVVPTMVKEVLRSPGQPLDSATRAFFERRFGHSFSAVRVHTDAKAAESARAVNARSYTVGRDIVFEAGQYAPTTREGRRLLAHELTHVVQQSRVPPTAPMLQCRTTSRASAPASPAKPATVFHPGVNHGHKPSGRWADVQANPNSGFWESRACANFEPVVVVGLAIWQEFSDKRLALDHLNWYLGNGMGRDYVEDANLERLLRTDIKVRSLLARLIPSRTSGNFTGHTRVDQSNYQDQDFRYAFGAIDRLDYEVDYAAGTVHAWFQDRYEWHPVYPGLYTKYRDDAVRETNCVHAALVELKSGGARDFWMKGEATVPLSVFRGLTSGGGSAPEGDGGGGTL